MTRQIPEKDWKIFRTIHPITLERFCEQIMEEIEDITSRDGQSAYERYIHIFKLIKTRDQEMGNIFNDFRRSTAWFQLRLIQAHGLLKPEEIGEFSEETREVLKFLS